MISPHPWRGPAVSPLILLLWCVSGTASQMLATPGASEMHLSGSRVHPFYTFPNFIGCYFVGVSVFKFLEHQSVVFLACSGLVHCPDEAGIREQVRQSSESVSLEVSGGLV